MIPPLEKQNQLLPHDLVAEREQFLFNEMKILIHSLAELLWHLHVRTQSCISQCERPIISTQKEFSDFLSWKKLAMEVHLRDTGSSLKDITLHFNATTTSPNGHYYLFPLW